MRGVVIAYLTNVHGTYTSADVHGTHTSADVHGTYTSADVHGTYTSADVHGTYTSADVHGTHTSADVHGTHTSADVHGTHTSADVHGTHTSADVHGTYPIHLASSHDHLDCLKFLVRHGCKLLTTDRGGRSCVHKVRALHSNCSHPFINMRSPGRSEWSSWHHTLDAGDRSVCQRTGL